MFVELISRTIRPDNLPNSAPEMLSILAWQDRLNAGNVMHAAVGMGSFGWWAQRQDKTMRGAWGVGLSMIVAL